MKYEDPFASGSMWASSEDTEAVKFDTLESDKSLRRYELDLLQKLSSQEGFGLTKERESVLRLKLSRYLERHEDIDTATLADAIVETPKFLDNPKGGFDRLLEIHEQKTIQKIAEMRRKRAEQTGNEKLNPYEVLFRTDSDKYYLARLLNMPHLEEESRYMDNCVGTSDSYINKMKRGEVEILSIRDTEKNEPILTIEYSLKTREIIQIKRKGQQDTGLTGKEEYFTDVVEILKKMKNTLTDAGDKRNFIKINPEELKNLIVKDYHILTDKGEVSLKDFDPSGDVFVLKMGNMNITPDIPKVDAQKIIKIISGIEYQPGEIARSESEVNENTKIYCGPLFKDIFQMGIENIYTAFPEGKIQTFNIEIGDMSKEELEESLEKSKNSNGSDKYMVTEEAQRMLKKIKLSEKKEKMNLVRLTVKDLGFNDKIIVFKREIDRGGTTDEIYKVAESLGLQLCPSEVGPQMRLKTDISNGALIAMEQIMDETGSPKIFNLTGYQKALILFDRVATPEHPWTPDKSFIFSIPKSTSKKA